MRTRITCRATCAKKVRYLGFALVKLSTVSPASETERGRSRAAQKQATSLQVLARKVHPASHTHAHAYPTSHIHIAHCLFIVHRPSSHRPNVLTRFTVVHNPKPQTITPPPKHQP